MIGGLHPRRVYDVCIVGSGAAGGVAAYVLSKAGLDVLLLEAGPAIDPQKDFKQHLWPYDLPLRGLGLHGRGDALSAPYLSSKLDGEPYTVAQGTQFVWLRGRCLGGRTNHWGRGVARFHPDDFKPHSRDGVGEDWPINYDDLEGYYEKVESVIGVFGTTGKSSMPPPAPRCTEKLVQQSCDILGMECVSASAAVLTREHNGRPACHYCGQCARGCKTASNFNSAQVLIPPALSTGKLQVFTNAVAREVIVGNDHRVRGVSYIRKVSRQERVIHCRSVVLAASACESARLLLNSTSDDFPSGLANSSGVVGRYLRDSVASQGRAYFPQLEGIPPHNHDGVGRHMIIPWSNRGGQHEFIRGYRIEFGGGREMPMIGDFRYLCDEVEGYGITLKRECRRKYGTFISFAGFGEMLPDEHNCCEIDPTTMDKWGIPVLRFNFRWHDNDLKMARDMQKTIRTLVEAVGGTYLTHKNPEGEHPFGISIGGENGHELGTVRMGMNPATSVLNGFCQSHDVKNLFVMDGGSFTSSPEKPPTLTIMAIAWRSSEYLIEQARKGNL